MSCNVGYKCKTCGVETDTWFNRGHDYLRALYLVWPHVKALLRTLGHYQKDLSAVVDLTVNPNGWYDSDLKEFLYDHHGHEVLIRDEYGKEEPITGG